MTLVDIESVIRWLDDNIERYDIEMGDTRYSDIRTFYDLKVDLRKWAEEEKEGEK